MNRHLKLLLGNWLNDDFIGLPTREHSLKTLPASEFN